MAATDKFRTSSTMRLIGQQDPGPPIEYSFLLTMPSFGPRECDTRERKRAMTRTPCYVPSDEEMGKEPDEENRRVLFMSTCVLCRNGYEIRDARWIETFTMSGRKIKVLVCHDCWAEEIDRQSGTAK